MSLKLIRFFILLKVILIFLHPSMKLEFKCRHCDIRITVILSKMPTTFGIFTEDTFSLSLKSKGREKNVS